MSCGECFGLSEASGCHVQLEGWRWRSAKQSTERALSQAFSMTPPRAVMSRSQRVKSACARRWRFGARPRSTGRGSLVQRCYRTSPIRRCRVFPGGARAARAPERRRSGEDGTAVLHAKFGCLAGDASLAQRALRQAISGHPASMVQALAESHLGLWRDIQPSCPAFVDRSSPVARRSGAARQVIPVRCHTASRRAGSSRLAATTEFSLCGAGGSRRDAVQWKRGSGARQ